MDPHTGIVPGNHSVTENFGRPGRPGDMLQGTRPVATATEGTDSLPSHLTSWGKRSQILVATRPAKIRIGTTRQSMPGGSWVPGGYLE